MSSPSLPPVLEQAQYELSFEQRVDSDLSRLTRAFLSDEETPFAINYFPAPAR